MIMKMTMMSEMVIDVLRQIGVTTSNYFDVPEGPGAQYNGNERLVFMNVMNHAAGQKLRRTRDDDEISEDSCARVRSGYITRTNPLLDTK
jgi:hypothetical protein